MKGELEDSVKLLVKVIRKASFVNSGLNFEVFLHKIDGIAEYERVDLLDSVSKLQKELFLENEMGDINLRSVDDLKHKTRISSQTERITRIANCHLPNRN